MNWWLARLGMIFSFPTIAVNYVKGVSPHACKGEEDDQHPYDGTVLLTRGVPLLCGARAVKISSGSVNAVLL